MNYIYNDFSSNVCYALTALLLKIQYRDSYRVDRSFRIADKIIPFRFREIDYELNNKILDSELEAEINSVLEKVKSTKTVLKKCIKQSMLNIIKINSRINITTSLNNLIDGVIEKLMEILDFERQKSIAFSKVNVDMSKLPRVEIDSSVYHLDNIINSSVVDNLNTYYQYTVQLLTKEQSDEAKIVPIIAQMTGNYENAFSKHQPDELFLSSQAISHYLDISIDLDNVSLYAENEIGKMLG